MNRKIMVALIVGAIVGIVVGGIVGVVNNSAYVTTPELGGGRDASGCLVSAGYFFDDVVNACARTWEIDSNIEKSAARIAVDYVGAEYGLTVSNVEIVKCKGCYNVTLSNRNKDKIKIKISANEVFTVTTTHYCTVEEKVSEMCTFLYAPVIGDNGQEYSNGCVACTSKEIDYWIKEEKIE
jgi:hypothetical protein